MRFYTLLCPSLYSTINCPHTNRELLGLIELNVAIAKAYTWSIAKQLQKLMMPVKNRRIDGACHPAIASVWRFLRSTGGMTWLQGLSWKTLMSWTFRMCSSACLCHVLNWLVSMYDKCHKAWIKFKLPLWWIGLKPALTPSRQEAIDMQNITGASLKSLSDAMFVGVCRCHVNCRRDYWKWRKQFWTQGTVEWLLKVKESLLNIILVSGIVKTVATAVYRMLSERFVLDGSSLKLFMHCRVQVLSLKTHSCHSSDMVLCHI